MEFLFLFIGALFGIPAGIVTSLILKKYHEWELAKIDIEFKHLKEVKSKKIKKMNHQELITIDEIFYPVFGRQTYFKEFDYVNWVRASAFILASCYDNCNIPKDKTIEYVLKNAHFPEGKEGFKELLNETQRWYDYSIYKSMNEISK